MRKNNLLSSDVDLKELAAQTKNFSGAEIEGLVRAAQSNAMNRLLKVSCCFLPKRCQCVFFPFPAVGDTLDYFRVPLQKETWCQF